MTKGATGVDRVNVFTGVLDHSGLVLLFCKLIEMSRYNAKHLNMRIILIELICLMTRQFLMKANLHFSHLPLEIDTHWIQNIQIHTK